MSPRLGVAEPPANARRDSAHPAATIASPAADARATRARSARLATRPARAMRVAFRARARGPAGSERSCPKQWQAGERPRARFQVMAREKPTRSASAASAPDVLVGPTSNARAAASSASGTATPSGAAREAGTPKPCSASREPARSRSLATPAVANTAASTTLPISTRVIAFQTPQGEPLTAPGVCQSDREGRRYW